LITESTAVLFLLPAWVLLVSTWILSNSFRDAGTTGR
jgi:cytochrome c-type biogenesis protein CcmH/NrfF